MYVAAQFAQAQSMLLKGGTAWNMFLMSGTVPESMGTFPFQLANMDSIFANAIAGIRVTAVNSAGYGQELLAFEHASTLFTLKMHGERLNNGTAGIQCLPQAIATDIPGMDEPVGYVNGLEDSAVTATASTHLVTGRFIQFDFGDVCSINKVLFANMSATTRNASNINVEYYDGSVWVPAASNVAVKTYNAAGIEITFAPISARLWRVRFLNDTGTVAANTLQYRFIRFFASELPSNTFDKTTTDVTWCVLVPANPTTATYKSADATQVPAMVLSAGGPLDGKVAVLNRRRAGISDSFSLVHLKVFGNVVNEVE